MLSKSTSETALSQEFPPLIFFTVLFYFCSFAFAFPREWFHSTRKKKVYETGEKQFLLDVITSSCLFLRQKYEVLRPLVKFQSQFLELLEDTKSLCFWWGRSWIFSWQSVLFSSSISLARILSHALATIFLGELGQGCNVHKQTWVTNNLWWPSCIKINRCGHGKSSSVTAAPMQDIMEKYFLVIKLCWALWRWKEKQPWRQGEQRWEDTQLITRTFSLWRIHPGSILGRNIGFEEKKCRFMACQRLITLLFCCICWIVHTRRIRNL